jgi:hypothetical protein
MLRPADPQRNTLSSTSVASTRANRTRVSAEVRVSHAAVLTGVNAASFFYSNRKTHLHGIFQDFRRTTLAQCCSNCLRQRRG